MKAFATSTTESVSIELDWRDITSANSNTFRAWKLIIWDEAVIISGAFLKAVDLFLHFINGNDHVPFGGKFLLFAHDFHEVLPVARMLIVINNRATGESDFAVYLLRIGDSQEETLLNSEHIHVLE